MTRSMTLTSTRSWTGLGMAGLRTSFEIRCGPMSTWRTGESRPAMPQAAVPGRCWNGLVSTATDSSSRFCRRRC